MVETAENETATGHGDLEEGKQMVSNVNFFHLLGYIQVFESFPDT